MTVLMFSTRDERARATVEKIIEREFQTSPPREIRISARNNHSGEPALYVYILMPEKSLIPEIAAQNRLSGELLSALQDIDDDRFPYVFYGPRDNGEGELQNRGGL